MARREGFQGIPPDRVIDDLHADGMAGTARQTRGMGAVFWLNIGLGRYLFYCFHTDVAAQAATVERG